MSGEEFVLSMLALVMGSAVLIVGIAKITGLIKSWINRNNGINDETFDRLAKAFIQHKKDTERRLQNIEAIISEESDSSQSTGSNRTINKPRKTIEIETKEEPQTSKQDGNLKNMLRE